MMDDLIRRAAGRTAATEPEQLADGAEAAVDFDAGARPPLSPGPPSMSALIQAANEERYGRIGAAAEWIERFGQ